MDDSTANSEPRGLLTTAARCEHVVWKFSGDEFWFLADAQATGDSVSLTESHSPEGTVVPRHVHHDADEMFYVLDGEYSFTISGETLVAGAGTMAFIPRGAWHGFEVTRDGRCLTVFAPGGYEQTFRMVAEAMDTGGDVAAAFRRGDEMFNTETVLPG